MNKVVFKPRTVKPTKGNKYYMRYDSGGWSGAVKGSPVDECDALANCVGYSQGRICEASERGKCDLLEPCNPTEMSKYLYGVCTTGQKPKVGAIAVWIKKDNAKAGHVGNIEAVVDDNTIVTSESHYGGKAFDLNIHTKNGSEKFYKEGYTFKEFIYSPYIITPDEDTAEDYRNLLADYEALRAEKDIVEDKLKLAIAEKEAVTKEAELIGQGIVESEGKVAELLKTIDEMKTERKDILASQHNTAKDNATMAIRVKELEDENKILSAAVEACKGRLDGDINGDGLVNWSDVFALIAQVISKKKA